MLGSFTVRPTSRAPVHPVGQVMDFGADQNFALAEHPREAGRPSRKPVAKMLFLILDWDFALSRPSATSTPIYIE